MGVPLGKEGPGLEDLLADHERAFLERLGPGPRPRIFFAPGRVNLFGAHLDYNGGPVMPTAIDRGTFVAFRPRPDRVVRLASTLDDETFEADLESLPSRPQGRWFDYPLGVLRELRARVAERGRAAGVRGWEVLFGGNLPIGAGLSSSASMCVATAHALDAHWGLGMDPMGLVECALHAERAFVGVQCGIMDPYAVGLARPNHLLWLDCKDASWAHLPIDFERVSIGVADSGVRRELAQGEFNRRVQECAQAFARLRGYADGAECLRDVELDVLDAHPLGGDVGRRARHVLTEVGRAFAARDALRSGDVARMGALMTETHASLRDLYDVSCPELDLLVDAAVDGEGVYGARLTGAGFGGCVVMLIERGAEESVAGRVGERFAARFGRRPPIELFGGDEGPREIPIR